MEAAIKQALAGLSIARQPLNTRLDLPEWRETKEFEEARLVALAMILLERAGRTKEANQLKEHWALGGPLRRPQVSVVYETELSYARAIGSPPPRIAARRWLGEGPVDVAALGGRVVLIGFWALWNTAAVKELEKWRDWQARFADRGLRVIGVTRLYGRSDGEDGLSSAREWERLAAFYAERRINFPVAVAGLDDITNEERFSIVSPPTVLLLDRAGRVRIVFLGRSGERDLESRIVRLLGEG